MGEDDGGCLSALRLFFRSTPPALVASSVPDDNGRDPALRQARLSCPVRTLFFLTSTIMPIFGLSRKCDGIGLACFGCCLV